MLHNLIKAVKYSNTKMLKIKNLTSQKSVIGDNNVFEKQ